MIANLIALYAYDNLRGDGLAVRWARLDMVTTNVSTVVALCWAMELAFYAATYGCCWGGRCKVAAMVGFWLLYVGILVNVY